MKKLCLFVIIIFCSFSVSSQSCLPEGITFSTQAQLDNFQTNYPNCTEIEGDVVIDGVIQSLNGLNVLTSIGGSLLINQTALVHLTGLDNLVSVGGYMRLNNNPSLNTLSGLENLSSIGGSLTFRSNVSLTSLSGLDNLNSIGDGLWIHATRLESLSGLENLTTMGGFILINSNTVLESLTGLDNVTSVYGAIKIWDNPVLKSISALNNITSIGYNLEIINNDSLGSLSGLDNIDASTIHDLYIYDNESLSSCEVQSVCDYLVSPNGIVDIYGNASACNSHTEIANACGIAINCLPYGNYHFESQQEIDSFQYNYPACIDLEGSLWISGSDVDNLNGLNVISSIGGGLNIILNPGLTSMTGLENLSDIGYHINISNNDALTSLAALENINSDNLSITVYANESLNSLSGLDNIDGNLMSGLFITDNPSLSVCDVQSICDYLATQPLIWFVSISENAAGCENREEVEEACGIVSLNEGIHDADLLIYPNPAREEINISVEGFRIDEVDIYTLSGQEVLKAQVLGASIDISDLNAGMYIVEVMVEGRKVWRKLLVQR